ncbi:hypothetical protein LC724_22165 [Blautia sp. RD014234]|nr:hypothetical protein [Blautia parvula]
MKKMAMFLGTAMLMTTILTGCGGTSEETDNGGRKIRRIQVQGEIQRQ